MKITNTNINVFLTCELTGKTWHVKAIFNSNSLIPKSAKINDYIYTMENETDIIATKILYRIFTTPSGTNYAIKTKASN